MKGIENLSPFEMEVLAFLQRMETCKIAPMKIQYFVIGILLLAPSFSKEISTEDILMRALGRMDNISHEFTVKMKRTGKKKKNSEFKVMVHWPEKDDILRETRILPLNSKKKKPSSFWEQKFRGGRRAAKWMTLPITGKLKDVSKKKLNKKNFSFSELEVTTEFIDSYSHTRLPDEQLGNFTTYLIESIEQKKKGKQGETKKLWINIDDYFIHKAEFYTKSGRLYRIVECSGVHLVEGLSFPEKVFVNDLKSKSEILLDISEISINPKFSPDLFIPKSQ